MSTRFDIARLGAQGDGVAETERGPVFVPFALPGEDGDCDASIAIAARCFRC